MIAVPAPLADARVLVFDLDGTLIDSLADIARHLDAALADHGLAPAPRDRVAEWVGYGSAQLVQRAVGDPEHAPAVLASYRAHYRARPVIETRLYDGIADMLDAVAPGRALAILTNKPHDLAVEICDALLARWHFARIAGERAGHPKKPDPAAICAIVEPLGRAPGEAVMIGDSEVDVATGRAAGARSVAVGWGLRGLDVLRAAGPDHVATSPAELAALFAS